MKISSWKVVAKAYAMSVAFWCGFALLMGLQYRPLSREHFWSSLVALLTEAVLRGAALAFWAPPIFYLVARYIDRSRHAVRYALAWGLCAIPFVLLNTSIVWLVVPQYDDAAQAHLPRTFALWSLMIRNGFADQIFIFVAVVVAAHAYNYLQRLQREEREKLEYQQALAASELQMLKMQLHPHFLFNTLHGITTLIDADPRSAKGMIVKLSNLLRKALDREGSDLVPLGDELQFVREYLDVEKMRLGARLHVAWQIAPETDRLPLPRMILQPLAENAIRHGAAAAREGGWIEIASHVQNGVLTVIVRNSVGGNHRSGTGLGLRNVESRLKYLYSGDATLRFELSLDHTATVWLSVPVLHLGPESMATRPQSHVVH